MEQAAPLLENRDINVQSEECPRRLYSKDELTGKWTVATWYCKKSTCDPCARWKAGRQAERILRFIGGRPCHHVVLTLQRTDEPLRRQLKQLLKSFTKLKKRRCWTRNIRGGARFIHVDHDGFNGIWGPHMHLILEAENLPSHLFEQAWSKITEGSWVTWDRRIDMDDYLDRGSSVGYASNVPFLKYRDDPVQVAAFGKGVKNVRLSAVLGGWRGKLKLS